MHSVHVHSEAITIDQRWWACGFPPSWAVQVAAENRLTRRSEPVVTFEPSPIAIPVQEREWLELTTCLKLEQEVVCLNKLMLTENSQPETLQ